MVTGMGRDKNAQTDRIEGETAGQWVHQIGREYGGVDHQITDRAGPKNHLALEPDRVRDQTLPERGGPSGLHIAPFEPLVTTDELEHLALSWFCGAHSRMTDQSVSEI